jgi:hypothetical protein
MRHAKMPSSSDVDHIVNIFNIYTVLCQLGGVLAIFNILRSRYHLAGIVPDKTETHVESIPANVFSRELLRPIDTGFVIAS